MVALEDSDESFALALQISLLSDCTDLTPLTRSQTPRQTTLLSDFTLARELFEQDLKFAQQVSSDRRLAASIRRAVVQDAEVIDSEVGWNEVFRKDLLLAQQLRATPDAPMPSGEPTVAPAKRTKLSHFVKSAPTGAGNLHCDVCTELLPDYEIVSLTCEHNYCRTCLRKTFLNTLTSLSFPPRCCNTIPTTLVAEVLDDQELEKYLHESVVYDATAESEKGRRNCARSTCGQVLLPGWIRGDVGLCLKCDGKTCMVCGGEAHPGASVLGMKLRQVCLSWRRCKYQFCYKCAAKWKTCSCIQADESYITGRVNAATTFATTSRTTSSFSRTISSANQTQLDFEHRQQALRYDEGLKRRLEELKTLRRTRESQRDVVMVDRMVWDEEEKIRRELMEEEKKKREKEKGEQRREGELKGVFGGLLGWVNDNVVGKGKGKGKERERTGEDGEFNGVVGRLVDWTMAAESTAAATTSESASTPVPKAKPANPAASRKRELSPATRDRMAGLGTYGVLSVTGV
ncbi:hypothetical protein BGX38DRAFT_1273036 [Terfezia claveryi]|nr:hypothetical protein BGX38DRAFT_1273036 [Terfezia claveryi]